MSTTGEFPIRAPLQFNRNEARSMVLQVLASAPTSPQIGLLYSDSALDCPYWYSSSRAAWVPLDATKSSGIPTTSILNFASTIKGYTLDSFAAAAGDVSIGGHKLINVATPVSSTDATNKAYVDAAVQSVSAGISGKGSCVAVSTTNIASLSGTATTVDGVVLGTVGQRVLLTGQTTASQNGPWVIQAGSWTRPTTDANNELETGALWFIEQGTSKAATQWWLNSPTAGTTITPGTTSVGIVQFSAAGTYTAGANGGLQLTGSAFSVLLPAGGGIVSDSTGLHIDTTVVSRKYVNANVGDGASTSITLTHNLGTKAIVVSLINNSTGDIEYASVNAATTTTVVLTFAAAPAASAYTAVVIG
jgi:hypothetical protein